MRRDPYTIDIDRRRNCYNCGGLGYLARNCKNQGLVSQGRRIEYEDNMNMINNLKEEKSLVVFN